MSKPIDLYELLPAVYRHEDAHRGYPLKALLAIISEQANVIREDIDRLWDNFFVETADDWVLPYIGDLVGNTPIHNVVRGRRADVAKTIYYRLRKGTLPMLEELVRDVTGWSVHAVAFFDILTWTQNVNHLRRNVGTIHLRDIDVCDRVHTAFDRASHSVDIRPFAPAAGWHHIPNVGFFIWRLGSYELTSVHPRQVDGVSYGYFFNPLGISQHLYNSPQAESDDTGLASEIHIAQPIRQIAFQAHPEFYFGQAESVGIRIDNEAKTADEIVCMDLSTWRQRTDGKIGVDVVNGRFALPEGVTPEEIDVSFQYGFSADVGGGSYERRDDETIRDPDVWTGCDPDEPGVVVRVSGGVDGIKDALGNWDLDATPRLIIHLEDSYTYNGDLTLGQNTNNRENVQLIIQAANKTRPMIAGSLTIPTTNCPARVALKGLLIEGNVRVAPESGLDLLEVEHCTLVPGLSLNADLEPVQPGTPSIEVGANNDLLDVVLDHSISGPLRIPPDTRSLSVTDSIVDNMASSALGRDYWAQITGGLNTDRAEDAVGRPVTIRIGDETHTLRTDAAPGTYDRITEELERAIRSAPGATQAFAAARVLRLPGIPRAIIIPGAPRRVRIVKSAAADAFALSSRSAHEGPVRVGARAGDLSSLKTPPKMTVLLEKVVDEALTTTTFDIALTNIPKRLSAASRHLQKALRKEISAVTALEAKDQFVRASDGRLVVYSLSPGVTLRFQPHANDPLSVRVLGLMNSLPAIGYDAAGIVPGPECTIENSTIMGTVSVRAMQMGSNSIFTDTVTCQRQQIGCLRFCYVPPGSVTPRRYRCQPDRALELTPDKDAEERVKQRIRPEFTTRRYGLPAYAQLSLDCAEEIRTGADNGAEMGVFNRLMQPQREANIHIRLREYLPFGLKAGLIIIN